MPHVEYPGDLPLAEARLIYFRANGFGDDGGYAKKVEWVKLGPLPLPVPNIPARVRALRFHDMHHVVTGYDTDWRGEFEIAAWELAAGCGRLWFAWLINLGGFFVGLLAMPRRVLRAFLRGAHSGGLYRLDPAEIERQGVAAVRARIGLDREALTWRLRDRLRLALITLAATLFAALHLALLLGAIALVAWLLLRGG